MNEHEQEHIMDNDYFIIGSDIYLLLSRLR